MSGRSLRPPGQFLRSFLNGTAALLALAVVASCSPSTNKVTCPDTQQLCGSVCSDLNKDPENCGGCGNACAAGQVCASGSCALACNGGSTQCGSACVSV